MKLLTFVVPCYNSESYMRRCIDSLLTGGKEVEIIIVNDGSTDATGEIAAEYEANYPEIVRQYRKKEDQSVNEQVMMKRIDQQIKVTELVAESVDLGEVRKVHPKLANYMRRNISIMLAISSIHLLLIHTDEALEKRKKMWENIRSLNESLYYRLRFSTLSGFTYIPGSLGAKLTVSGYGIAKKIYQFQ